MWPYACVFTAQKLQGNMLCVSLEIGACWQIQYFTLWMLGSCSLKAAWKKLHVYSNIYIKYIYSKQILYRVSLDNCGFPGGISGKESVCQSRRCKRYRFDSWVRKNPGVGNGNPLKYSCLENSRDRGAWQAIVHGGHKSWTWLSYWAHSTISDYTCLYALWLCDTYFRALKTF